MLSNIGIGLLVMALCLLMQAVLLLLAGRYYTRREEYLHTPAIANALWVIGGVMIILVIGNLVQVGVWALVFQRLGEFQEYPDAYYHSAVNFATLGYGDFVMSERHRLLGPLEAINGVLMIGVSTSVLMTAFQDALRKTVEARQQKSK